MRYQDYMFCLDQHCVLLEVDEHAHAGYDPKCEVARISEIIDSIPACMNLHVIRYNPHGSYDDMRGTLLRTVLDALSTNMGRFNDTGCVVQYVGYTQDRVVRLDCLACILQDEFTTLD